MENLLYPCVYECHFPSLLNSKREIENVGMNRENVAINVGQIIRDLSAKWWKAGRSVNAADILNRPAAPG